MTSVERDRPKVAAETGKPPLAALLGLFAAMVVLLTTVATVAAGFSTTKPHFTALNGPAWLDAWYAFDSDWYFQIASNGYSYTPGQQSSVAFFPTFPLAVRAVSWVVGDVQIAGQLLAVLGGAASVTLFTLWVWRRLPRRGALMAVAVLMLYPFAFFLYGPMYGDSLFLLVALTAFLLLERRHYWLAGVVGALATAGRPNGVAAAIGLVLAMLEILAQRRLAGADQAGRRFYTTGLIRPRFAELVAAVPSIRWREAGVFVSGLGLAGWCVYLWVTFGNPLLFLDVQSTWDQGAGPRTWFKIEYFDILLAGGYRYGLLLTVQAVAVLIGLLLVPRVVREFGWGYAAYAFVVLLIPLVGTGDFLGTGRYVMVAFPVVAAAGSWLGSVRRRWVSWAVFAVLGIGIVTATSFYAVGELIT